MSSEDAQSKFEDVDMDKDGFATWTEHLKETWGLENDENLLQSEEYKDEYVVSRHFDRLIDWSIGTCCCSKFLVKLNIAHVFQMIKEETLLFNAADRNQDGKLTEEEYMAFDRPEQYDYMQPLVIQRTKESRDKNGDGFIDFHEYIVDIVPNYKSKFFSSSFYD